MKYFSLSNNVQDFVAKYKVFMVGYMYHDRTLGPLQAWTGPECSRRLRLSTFKTIGT
jgi:hypothetical protein